MKIPLRPLVCGVTTLVFACGTASAKITLDLDYSLDANGFFNSGTTNGQLARATLARAADTYNDRFLDTLTAITEYDGNTWLPNILSPSSTGVIDLPSLNTVPANVIKVFAGGQSIGGNTLGIGGPGGWNASAFTQAYFDNIEGRGQSGTLAAQPTDVSPWGGSITFDNGTNWNLNYAVAPTSGKNDFYSVALHELGHLLGFGASPTFENTFSSGGFFTGPKSKAVNGGANVPLGDEGHFSNDLTSTVTGTGTQQPMMSPSIQTGTRKLPTILDWAGFDDIGWTLARPGDANADGGVGFADLVLLAQNYNANGPAISWSEGDFNYDGQVSFSDLVALAQNYNSSGGLLTEGDLAGFGSSFAADWALAQSVVPEPTTLALLAGVAIAGSRRRRTR